MLHREIVSQKTLTAKRCVTVSPVTACYVLLLRGVKRSGHEVGARVAWSRTDRSLHGGVASGVVSVLLLTAKAARN